MTRPSSDQKQAAARVLRECWDADGSKSLGEHSAYQEWGFGIADMILHGADSQALAEYLAILESQIGVPLSALSVREVVSVELLAAVESAAPEQT